jgi:long-subunit acyl-CoA synthetase (AMP-forming)
MKMLRYCSKGLTECASIVAWSRAASIIPGSSGSLLPSCQARLIDDSGADITNYDVPGELYLKSPSRIPGYLVEDESVNAQFLVDGWLPTGDIGFFRLGPKGDEHLFLVDRLKDMIKVNVCFYQPKTAFAFQSDG